LNFGLTSQALTRTQPPCASKSWLRRQELRLIGTHFCSARYFASKAGTILPSTYSPQKENICGEIYSVLVQLSIPFVRPSMFPRNGVLAARVACRFASEPWIAGFAKAVFHANFGEDREIYDPEVVVACLNGLGLDGQLVLEQAQTAESNALLRAQTEKAKSLGIFGAPSFLIGEELFWGNDRLEEALAWARLHS
jgi:2-hydroxychromene-2-carboxylate isomerase